MTLLSNIDWRDFDAIAKEDAGVSWRSLALHVFERLRPTICPGGASVDAQNAAFQQVAAACKSWIVRNRAQLYCVQDPKFVPGRGMQPPRFRRVREGEKPRWRIRGMRRA